MVKLVNLNCIYNCIDLNAIYGLIHEVSQIVVHLTVKPKQTNRIINSK